MFTGLVERVGALSYRATTGNVLTIGVQGIDFSDIKIGDSIACNGVCLTLTDRKSDEGRFELMQETAEKTLFPILPIGAKVNIERSLRADSRLDGHFVQGHIDTVGSLLSVFHEKETIIIRISVDKKWAPYFVTKGSIALNGVSLTIIEAHETWFTVGIIPHTFSHTSLGFLREGDGIHCEFDIIGKYIERWLSIQGNTSQQSLSEVLRQW